MSTLVIFSGLPGTGKSTLANRLARELQWTLLRIDDVVNNIPEDPGVKFWDSQVEVLLTLTEAQLEIGLNVIVDSVFMNTDRQHAQQLAEKYGARFRPIYSYLSDDAVWEQRVTARSDQLNNKAVATWQQVQHQRGHFREWQSDTALLWMRLTLLNKIMQRSCALSPVQKLRSGPWKTLSWYKGNIINLVCSGG